MSPPSPSNEASIAAKLQSNRPTTSDQREAAFSKTAPAATFGFGKVVGCGDSGKGGQLLIQADIFGPGTVPCSYVSPVGGGGAGFFAIPGIGATVLCANIPSTNPPVQNVWMGCLYPAGSVIPESYISQPYSKTDREVAKFYTPEEFPPRGKAIGATAGAGVPNQNVIYADNGLPNSYVFQHPAGHSLRMTKKVTDQRDQNEIVMRSAMGKRLVLSDSPASKGGNALQLLDEDDNGLSIYTQSTAPSVVIETEGNISQISRQGDITSTIGANTKDRSIAMTNGGMNSHIGVSSIGEAGTLNLTATKEILLKVGPTTLRLSEEGLTINAPKVNIEGGDGSELTLASTPFVDHTHGFVVNIPNEAVVTTTASTGVGTAIIDGPAMKAEAPATTTASTGTGIMASPTGGISAGGITGKPETSTGSTGPNFI